MKKLLTILAFLFSLSYFAGAQNIAEIRKDFEEQVANGKIPYGNNPAAGKYYDIRGFKMYCETYGEGQPVLIIHGNGGSINNFIYQIPYFSKNYKVIIADSRAQGKSKDDGDSLSYEMMADDYAALLTAMKVDSAYVIGWSDGGINGLLLAIRHPEKVKKLAVTGANLAPDTSAVNQDVIDMIMPSYIALKNKPNKNGAEKHNVKLTRLLMEEPHIPLSDLHTIKCPSLIIGGDHDILKPAHTLLIFQNIPKAYLWILPNSGHSTPIVYKDEFNKTVNEFFSQPYRKITGEARFF
ncbi:MAG: alpha/beta hydrolase [Bacteroidetes bacterium]|nr:alpha/beta hydrolase [Bacteroidota bacterium]